MRRPQPALGRSATGWIVLFGELVLEEAIALL
jgi:hypothetical protein